jgi:hypothetical protein
MASATALAQAADTLAPPAAPAGPLVVQHDALRRWLEQLGGDEVKHLYVACSRRATRSVLGAGEAAACSITYDVLLKRHFAGDFAKLLAWSRQHR